MVPRRAAALDELQRDALGRLLVDHRPHVVVDAAVALEELEPEGPDPVDVAVDDDVAFEHDAAQLVVRVARLDLERRARVALEVAHLLGLGERPRPHLRRVAVAGRAHDVPERHEVRPAAPAVRRADHGPLLAEEREHLLVGHLDLVAPAHGRSTLRAQRSFATAWRTASRASSGSSTAASPASASTRRTSQSVPLNGIATTTAPSASSAVTDSSSRAHRARSGEYQTRAIREAGTSPVRGQPSTSPSASISGRGSNVSSSTSASLIRSRRKWRRRSLSTSTAATYQPSRPLKSAYGSIVRALRTSSS